MTRRVRSGNTQKHKKIPGEATKWGEFDLQKTSKSFPEKQEKRKSEQDFDKCSANIFVSDSSKDENFNSTESDGKSSTKTHSSFKRKKSIQSKIFVADNDSEAPQDTDSTHEPKFEINKSSDKVISLDSTVEKSSIKCTVSREMDKIKEENDSHLSDGQDKTTNKVLEKKNEIYMKKLQNRRAKNGITLLSAQAERKLYQIKKKLRRKGVPPEELKEVIRKERRKEELKFRKTNNPSKLCFLCRQPGHFLANCPQKLGTSITQETGICFKCGNDRHTSFKCPKKIQGFPFAKCFICKEQGHISKDCPRNKRGVYPKGGKCNLCGNINHLRKDCPSLSKKAKTEESVITLNTIKNETSVDDDEVVVKKGNRKESVKKPKLVKF